MRKCPTRLYIVEVIAETEERRRHGGGLKDDDDDDGRKLMDLFTRRIGLKTIPIDNNNNYYCFIVIS